MYVFFPYFVPFHNLPGIMMEHTCLAKHVSLFQGHCALGKAVVSSVSSVRKRLMASALEGTDELPAFLFAFLSLSLTMELRSSIGKKTGAEIDFLT